ncbi:MAG TPA: ATP-binding cassette domain-containing protein [Candidatus Onthenecus intestinigallinarum]|uniref:ATP-binding cassette domain-containing protein n=1 Tax=Candidatus Onthenecus intestinigallinarum TaxID=2840875 RepID=A0A9D1CPX3_9FIRM|nr:ATP-binding cassette domain-containing protein [Candidatus Onthenecus intestinigallinarum]
MLELKRISWDLPDGGEILRHIDLTVPDGKLIVVTGPNGGGKTTLAKIIAGLETPSGGSIWLDGQDITGLDVTQRARLGIAYAFQQPVRFKGITVRMLLELAAGGSLKENEACAFLAKVGLCAREYIDREVNASLSGGEIKRIEIATVLARGARLSIFDEPEAGIDLWSFSSLIDAFGELRGKLSGSLLIISHQERILNIADEIIVIADGGVRVSGPREDVLPKLLSGESFAGCPVMEGVGCK